MFAEKNLAAWSDLLDFIVERAAADILGSRAVAGAPDDQREHETQTELPCAH